ncbi:GntR family transcriptional regulator [Micromonospora rifamycinica]|uniref:GntR family transcriptional regulator n=1 Tax=Micromonospora rifamycinica TaxID=291594 RepID=UPI0033E900FE
MTIPMGYRKIAADPHARIQQGEYPPESRLPTYAELARLYSASVSTVQRAVMLLQAHGIIVGVQGAACTSPRLPPPEHPRPAQRMRPATRRREPAPCATPSQVRRVPDWQGDASRAHVSPDR